jgi:hypothetical protein
MVPPHPTDIDVAREQLREAVRLTQVDAAMLMAAIELLIGAMIDGLRSEINKTGINDPDW